MFHKTTTAALPSLMAMALLAVGCRDAVSPSPHGLGAPAFATTAGAGIALDQQNGVFGDAIPWGNGGTHVGKGFDPRNPHNGDAIVATFFWLGSTNTIVTVTERRRADAGREHLHPDRLRHVRRHLDGDLRRHERAQLP